MKKVILSVFVILTIFIVGGMSSAGMYGPPELLGKARKTSIGIGYFWYSYEWQSDEPGWLDEKLNAKQNQFYLQLNYGFTHHWEGYLRLGFGDLKVDKVSIDQTPAKYNIKPFGTAGIKGVLYSTNTFGIGSFCQATVFSNYKGTWSNYAGDNTYRLTLGYKNISDINLGITLQGKIPCNISEIIIYGGPFLNWSKVVGTSQFYWKDEYTGLEGSGDLEKADYKQTNSFGVFLGSTATLGKGIYINVETQFQPFDRFSIGMSLNHSFWQK